MACNQRYKNGKCSLTHNDERMKNPKARMIHAQTTLESLMCMNVDQMPHHMKGIENGR